MFVVKIMCYWFVILSAVHAAATQPIPPKRVRMAGGNLELMCTVGNGSTVMWDLTPPSDATKSVMIASSRNQPTNSRYKVDCNTPGTCRLLITDISLTDAGLYRCMETTAHNGVVEKPQVDLTVLAAVPTCATVITYKTSKLLDDLKIRCQVSYSGTEQPFIHCQELSANIWPSPATAVDTGNSSHHSLSFTYDIDVDRITKETRLECTMFLNRKDFPDGHVQYTWRWSSDTDEENRVATQSGSSPPELTTTSVEASSSPSSTNQGVMCSSSRDQRSCSSGTTLSASISTHGQTFERPAELYSISNDNEGPVPPLPFRSQSSRDTPLVAEREMRAGCQVMSNVVLQHVNSNELSENTPFVSVNPTYAELSVSFRTDRTHRPTRPTDTSRAVYADINHLMQIDNKKNTKR